MKRILAVILLISMVVACVACTPKKPPEDTTPLPGDPVTGAEAETLMDNVKKTGNIMNFTIDISSQTGTNVAEGQFQNGGNGIFYSRVKKYSLASSFGADLPPIEAYYDLANKVGYVIQDGVPTPQEDESLTDLSIRGAIDFIMGDKFYNAMLAAMANCWYNADKKVYVLSDFSYTYDSKTVTCKAAEITLNDAGQLVSFELNNSVCIITINVSNIDKTSVTLPEIPEPQETTPETTPDTEPVTGDVDG